MRMMTGGALVGLVLVASTACSSARTGGEVDVLLGHTLRASIERTADGDAIEAYQLARAVADVDPDYPGVQLSLSGLPQDLDHLFDNEWLGSNVALRQPVDAAWWEHVLWYVPDRVLDLADIVSFDVHLGFGLYADVHATRAAQVNGGFRTVAGFGWHEGRSLGIKTQSQAGVNVLPFGAEGYSAMSAGTSGVHGGSWGEAGIHEPGDALYQDYRDYWAIGGGATILFVGAEADLHPVQVWDFVAGLLTFDPLNDDFASTTSVDFSPTEERLVRSLGEVAVDGEALEAYVLWRAEHDAPLVASSAPLVGTAVDVVGEDASGSCCIDAAASGDGSGCADCADCGASDVAVSEGCCVNTGSSSDGCCSVDEGAASECSCCCAGPTAVDGGADSEDSAS